MLQRGVICSCLHAGDPGVGLADGWLQQLGEHRKEARLSTSTPAASTQAKNCHTSGNSCQENEFCSAQNIHPTLQMVRLGPAQGKETFQWQAIPSHIG